MLWQESLWIYTIWSMWHFLDDYIHVFHKIREVSVSISLNHLPAPFLYTAPGTPKVCMLVYFVVSYRPLGLSLLQIFSFFSDLKIPTILFSSSLFLLPTQTCFQITQVNFSFQLLYFSIAEFLLFMVSLYSYFHFVHEHLFMFVSSSWSCPHLTLALCISLKQLFENICWVNQSSSLSQGHFLFIYFPFDGPYFLVCTPCDFFLLLLKMSHLNLRTLEIRFSHFSRVCCFLFLLM